MKDKCVRCNCDRIAIYHCLDHSYGSSSSGEHLEKICRNCFYTWLERCTDFDWLKHLTS